MALTPDPSPPRGRGEAVSPRSGAGSTIRPAGLSSSAADEPDLPALRARLPRRLLRDPGTAAGLALVLGLLLLATVGPQLAPYDPAHLFDDGLDANNMPLGHTARFLLGTDPQGRDVLSRLLWGARTTLSIAAVAMGMTALVGVAVGCLAGYLRGWLDVLLMRTTDVLLAFPPVLLAMGLAAITGGGFVSVAVVVALVAWPPLARTVYAQVLTIRERDYVEAARALGAGGLRILGRHIAPQVLPVTLVYTTLGVATAVSLESTLSFLGFGVPATGNSWGVMINISLDGDFYRLDPPLLLYPGLAIVLTVLGFTLVGEGLRRALESA